MEKKNTVVSREEIMKKLWDSDCFIDDNTLTVNMTRIRKKLEDRSGTIYYDEKGNWIYNRRLID